MLVLPVGRWHSMEYTGNIIPPAVMFVLFIGVMVAMFFAQGSHLNWLSEKVGFLDGDSERDTIPKDVAPSLGRELLFGLVGRSSILIFLCYDECAPLQLSWWLPIQLGTLSIIADFVYYWVHRASHEVGSLWYLHKRHHTTKHPNFLLRLCR